MTSQKEVIPQSGKKEQFEQVLCFRVTFRNPDRFPFLSFPLLSTDNKTGAGGSITIVSILPSLSFFHHHVVRVEHNKGAIMISCPGPVTGRRDCSSDPPIVSIDVMLAIQDVFHLHPISMDRYLIFMKACVVYSEPVVIHGVLKKFVVPYRLPDPRRCVFSLGMDFVCYMLQQHGIEGDGIPPEKQ